MDSHTSKPDNDDGRNASLPQESPLNRSLSLAMDYTWDNMREDSHWRGEVVCNVTITAEQVFIFQCLGKDPIPDAELYKRYLLSEQQEDGSWALATHSPGDISASCEAYLALKILGLDPSCPEMKKARDFILQAGGVAKVRVFTRIFFAQFGLFPWDATPQLPAEIILLPTSLFFNIYRLSTWARSAIIPLLIMHHHKPIYSLPNGKSAMNDFVDELWLDPANKMVSYYPPMSIYSPLGIDPIELFFSGLDAAMYYLGGLRRSPLRKRALRECVQWIIRSQEPSGDWAGISPPMHSNILALLLEGFSEEDPVIKLGMEAIERFTWQDDAGKRMQSCVSPIWDTALMIRAICDSGWDKRDSRLEKSICWLRSRQIRKARGGWCVYRPHIVSGGFSFQYYNDFTPDVDDTAVVILALLHRGGTNIDWETIERAVLWICGMQNSDGGWGAFDADNDKLWLNKIPFGDLKAMCDNSAADLTGHILEAFGMALKVASQKTSHEACSRLSHADMSNMILSSTHRAVHFLAKQQETFGGWYGRWGVNYIYGTSAVVSGLAWLADGNSQVKDMITAAVSWVKQVQNPDGGWGEGLESYEDPTLAGRGSSTPSQTSWAIMCLLEVLDPNEASIVAGVKYLLDKQQDASSARQGASWTESRFTGTGFPRFLYLRYSLYSHYFPIMALGRYKRAIDSTLSS